MSFWCLQFSQKMNKNNSTWGTIVVKSKLLGHQLYSPNYSDKPISTEFSHQRHSEICIDSCAAVGVLQIFYDGANIVSLYSLGPPSVSFAQLFRALPDITSGPKVWQIFKIRTFRKPDVFLPRTFNTFKNRLFFFKIFFLFIYLV